jgi:anti-anti-sigma regulatory factor/anti-sigma regulatory factor (Ser/Thr protein kinase)
MSPDLHWVIERDTPFALIRLTGVLNLASAPAARAGLGKCLAAHPAAIIVDVSGLRIGDAGALAVFAETAREATRWPGAPLLLCRPGPETAAVLGASSVVHHLPVFPTLEAAMAGIDGHPALSQLRLDLQPTVGAARRARQLVTEACARWDVPYLVGPACTVVTELVNNAVVHAGTPMEVVIQLRERHVNISVRDASPEPPRPGGPVAPTAPGGRGLMMVEAVAAYWGHQASDGGKVVWAVLRTTDNGHGS